MTFSFLLFVCLSLCMHAELLRSSSYGIHILFRLNVKISSSFVSQCIHNIPPRPLCEKKIKHKLDFSTSHSPSISLHSVQEDEVSPVMGKFSTAPWESANNKLWITTAEQWNVDFGCHEDSFRDFFFSFFCCLLCCCLLFCGVASSILWHRLSNTKRLQVARESRTGRSFPPFLLSYFFLCVVILCERFTWRRATISLTVDDITQQRTYPPRWECLQTFFSSLNLIKESFCRGLDVWSESNHENGAEEESERFSSIFYWFTEESVEDGKNGKVCCRSTLKSLQVSQMSSYPCVFGAPKNNEEEVWVFTSKFS